MLYNIYKFWRCLMERCVYAIIDGQAGSSGKGKVIGQFALEENVDVAVTNCMPNAGHTFVENGKKRVFRNIPVSAVNPNTTLFIGPGSAIDMNVLEEEYENNRDILENREIIVHPMVPLIERRHIEYEKKHLKSGSTFKGCGAVLAEKVMRSPDLKFFKEFKNIKSDTDYYYKMKKYLLESKKILLEGAQGADLDLNHSGHYPYTTSRQVSVAQMLADSGISPMYLKEVIMVIRPFPIRISNNIYDGTEIYSGDYGKSEELTWEQINVGAHIGLYPTLVDEELISDYKDEATDLTEFTTVTKKPRRIFDIDLDQLKKNVMLNTPSQIYLNFFEHLDSAYKDASGIYSSTSGIHFDKYRKEYIYWLEEELGVPITMLGTGPDINHYIDRRPYLLEKKK